MSYAFCSSERALGTVVGLAGDGDTCVEFAATWRSFFEAIRRTACNSGSAMREMVLRWQPETTIDGLLWSLVKILSWNTCASAGEHTYLGTRRDVACPWPQGEDRRLTTSSSAFRSSRNARDTLLDFRDRVELHLSGPRPIDRPQGLRTEANIEREVGDQHVVAVEYQAIRPEKTDRAHRPCRSRRSRRAWRSPGLASAPAP